MVMLNVCVVVVKIWLVIVLACVHFFSATIEPTVDEFGEEDFEDFEENQDKPPNASHLYLLHTLILVLLMQFFNYVLCKVHCF
jgi:hypothetical protein